MTVASIYNKRFSCPHCEAFADHEWRMTLGRRIWANSKNAPPSETRGDGTQISYKDGVRALNGQSSADAFIQNVFLSKCESCEEVTIWVGDKQIYPAVSSAPVINPDTPEAIAADYHEAASIMSSSPRGAAALLRLAIQKLCAFLGEDGKNINKDISELVKKGLDHRIQQALDALRVIGNEAVHPGTMDLNDDPKTVESLFKLFNIIVDRMISEPKHIASVYELLPPEKIAQIEARDKTRETKEPN